MSQADVAFFVEKIGGITFGASPILKRMYLILFLLHEIFSNMQV